MQFQAEVLAKSYHDFVSMIEFCSTAYIYAIEYRTRKRAFATYAANNKSSAAIGGIKAATVMIHRNAMTFELNELCRYFHIYVATDADRARTTPGRITPDPRGSFRTLLQRLFRMYVFGVCAFDGDRIAVGANTVALNHVTRPALTFGFDLKAEKAFLVWKLLCTPGWRA